MQGQAEKINIDAVNAAITEIEKILTNLSDTVTSQAVSIDQAFEGTWEGAGASVVKEKIGEIKASITKMEQNLGLVKDKVSMFSSNTFTADQTTISSQSA